MNCIAERIPMNINLEYYKIFYYVGKLGQVTMAARELSISQPAVSQAMKNLETQLNTRLFLRTPKGIRLTGEGKLLYDYISRGYETILQGERQLWQMLNLSAGEIRIGASDMTLQFYLLPYLEHFHQQHPGIKVSVTNAPTPETLRNLHSGQIDFGVVSTPFPMDDQVEAVAVKEVSDIFIAGSRFREFQGKVLDYQALTALPIICLEENTSTRRCIDQWLASKNVKLRPEFELATSDMIVQFAVRNLGIGYVMSGFAEQYIRQGQLFPLEFKEGTPRRDFCVVTSKNAHVSNAADQLLDMLSSKVL